MYETIVKLATISMKTAGIYTYNTALMLEIFFVCNLCIWECLCASKPLTNTNKHDRVSCRLKLPSFQFLLHTIRSYITVDKKRKVK